MGQPYHGIGLPGYDNVTKKFQGHFFERIGQILVNGSYDAASKNAANRRQPPPCHTSGTNRSSV
jgi:hypothetical protein